MTEVLTHKASCHCGAVSFEFDAPRTATVTHCDCSICAMTAYQHVFIPQSDVRFISRQDSLTTYTFNTGAAKHMFCKVCGIKPLYIPRSHPECYSINLRCVQGGTLLAGDAITFSGRDWERNISDLKTKT